MMQTYAVIAAGGKQYRIWPGQVIDVEQISGDEGTAAELDKVLLIAGGEKIITGEPTLDGARVKATIVRQGRHRKVMVFKYKSKVRYRRKRGHRQPYTRLMIDEILTN
jgi:large subunit ribosomal protein L21